MPRTRGSALVTARCACEKVSFDLVLERTTMERQAHFERTADGFMTYAWKEGRRLTGFGRTEDEALADLRVALEMDERLTALARQSKHHPPQEQR